MGVLVVFSFFGFSLGNIGVIPAPTTDDKLHRMDATKRYCCRPAPLETVPASSITHSSDLFSRRALQHPFSPRREGDRERRRNTHTSCVLERSGREKDTRERTPPYLPPNLTNRRFLLDLPHGQMGRLTDRDARTVKVRYGTCVRE